MKNEPLVSMITYCYNGARFVSNYFEAILKQTYSNIELIFFNNGSEDKTGDIAESYRKPLEDKGVKVNIIHYSENQSTCELKQKAFQMMNGEYFFGCDSDDFIDPTYIEEMTEYLVSHSDKGIVYCQLRVVQEETGEVLSVMKMTPRYKDKEAFEDILCGTNINFTSISYMMSKRHFEQVNPTKSIYNSRYGENYQVQMPFLYHNLQGYIEKPLGQYTVRRDNYSSKLSDPKKRYEALKGQEKSVLATLMQIQPDNIEYYEKFFLSRIRRELFYTALFWNDALAVQESYSELKQIRSTSVKEKMSFMLSKMGLFLTISNLKDKFKK